MVGNVFAKVSKKVYGYCGLNMAEHLWKQYHWYEKVGDFASNTLTFCGTALDVI